MSESTSTGAAGFSKGSLALRPREAARSLGISERTLWAWTKAGRVPHLKVNRAVLYSVESLQKWLADGSMTEGEQR